MSVDDDKEVAEVATEAVPEPFPGRAGLDRSLDPTVSASIIRTTLHLTPHQLGDLTARLALDVGDRANYPRYSASDHLILIATQTLRDLRLPLESAVAAAVDFQDVICSGRGWLLAYPEPEQWTVLLARSPQMMMQHLVRMDHLAVLDLASVAGRANTLWAAAVRDDTRPSPGRVPTETATMRARTP